VSRATHRLQMFPALLAATLLLSALGCASSAPMIRVDRIDQLVGEWSGTVSIGRGMHPITVTIKPDGALTAVWRSTTAEGRVTVANGQAGYQMAPLPQEGTFSCTPGPAAPSTSRT
jgi:hypothetical protein